MGLPLPDEFFTMGGLTHGEFCERWTDHWHAAERSENQGFTGTWVEDDREGEATVADERWIVTLTSRGNTVEGKILRPLSAINSAPIHHLRMVGGQLVFTFRKSRSGEIFEVRAAVEGDRMEAHLFGTEDDYGVISLTRMN